MRHSSPLLRWTTALATLAGAALLTGCPNPNTYGTPRTTPRGEVQHTVALEAVNFSGTVDKVETNPSDGTTRTVKEDVSVTLPTLPTYQLRYGISDELDFGVRVANLSTIGGDLKYNFLKTDSFDMAVDPGFQYIRLAANDESIHIGYVHLPVLLALNLSESVSLVASPGVVYAFSSANATGGGRDSITSGDGFLARFGLGADFRFSKSFALHPEVTLMRSFEDTNAMMIVGGLGFNFGKLPKYGAEAPIKAK